MVPNWREVEATIPHGFRDDGASDPVLMVWLRRSTHEWARRLAAWVDRIARVHDYGYAPARLSGSPWEAVTKTEWDMCYRNGIQDGGDWKYKALSRIHRRALRPFGWIAWWRNARQMREWGWTTYSEFLADPDHSYTGGGGSVR